MHEWLRRRCWGATIEVLDIEAGPGVTIVADARTWRPEPGSELYDLVISTECLEHVEGWTSVIATAAAALKVGGWFVGTCASIGRGPHGATGAPSPAKGEWYRNVWPQELVGMARSCFGFVNVQYEQDPSQPTTCDLYWRAQKS